MKIQEKSCILLGIIITVMLYGWCYCNAQTVEVSAEMEKTEKQALFTAIQGFVGKWWNGSDLYPDPCGWTPIQGVSCDFLDGFWYATDLNIGPLQDNSLTCTENPEFNPQIFELKHLKSLSFYNCFSSHNTITLPTDKWDSLAGSLESLEFRSNSGLIGSMPSTFNALQMLKSLVVIENGLTGNLPSYIGNLRHLKRLVMSGNKFTGQVPDSIGHLSELLILDLSRNQLSGHLPNSIGYLNSLLKLDLSNNLLMGNIPNEIGNLKNLTLLDLRNNKLSGGLTKSLEEMDSLHELMLSSNLIGGDINKVDWQKMQSLMILDLSNVGLSGTVPKSMANLKKLRYVGLGNNNLTGILPSELANMPSVSAIYVNGNNLTGVLKFPEGFYGKLGRRFGAWNNPSLCYIAQVMSSEHAPIGVQPCNSEEVSRVSDSTPELGVESGKLQQQLVWIPSLGVDMKLDSENVSSFGLSKCGTDGVWLVLLLELFMVVLLWNLSI